jgi:hypothetical protein
MPDWEALVSERLDTSGLTPEQRDQVVAELAGHFEEFYKERRAKGYCESKAIERALSQVDDWPELARKISAAKRGEKSTEMRAKSFWLPGLHCERFDRKASDLAACKLRIRHPPFPACPPDDSIPTVGPDPSHAWGCRRVSLASSQS